MKDIIPIFHYLLTPLPYEHFLPYLKCYLLLENILVSGHEKSLSIGSLQLNIFNFYVIVLEHSDFLHFGFFAGVLVIDVFATINISLTGTRK